MKWEEVIQPRDAGGPHIRNGFRASQALAAKQYWRLITVTVQKGLWKEILLRKYCPSMNQKDIANGAGLRFGRIEPEAEMDYRGGDEFVKLQTASEENSMTGRATNKSGREKYLNASRVQNK